MNINRIALAALFTLSLFHSFTSFAQQMTVPVPRHDSLLTKLRTTKFPVMKTVVNTPVVGAPLLSSPERIDGKKLEIRTEEHGLIYPIAYDWNHDGKQDLLLGEFLTGKSRLLVYINKGTQKKPKFTGEWFYATDVNGDTLYTDQWCCIGFHPQVVDVDGDGYDDLISGQYNPGKVSWWRGSAKGFMPRQYIDQEGYEEGKHYSSQDPTSPNSNEYWNYTTARLADFNGDGLMDLFVGGSGGYRVALNIGTKANPKFGRREYLYHLDGTILHSYRGNDFTENLKKRFNPTEVCGDGKAMLNPVDWDGDGVLDILLTPSYTSEEQHPIYFFRGIKTQDGLRFEHAVPLITADDGSKLFPGTCPQIQVCDWNNDGVNDLLLGLAIPTINEMEGADECYYRWTHEMGIEFPGKDSGENFQWYPSPDSLFARMAREPWLRDFSLGKLNDLKYVTLRHRGYPFVMYGKAPHQLRRGGESQATAIEAMAQPSGFELEQATNVTTAQKPVVCNIDCTPYITKKIGACYLHVTILLNDGYHLYTDSPVNKDFIPTTVDITLPDGLSFIGNGPVHSDPVMRGMNEVYENEATWYANITADFSKFTEETQVPLKIKVTYQTCNSEMCLPPIEEEKTIMITVKP